MSILDVYLQRHNKKRYDVFKTTGLSQQTLSSMSKKEVGTYSIRTIQSIAKTVGKSEGEVVDGLLQLEKENAFFEVFTTTDLLLAFENEESYILIKKAYVKEMKVHAESQLTPSERLGFELGSAGIVTIVANGIYKLANLFSKQSSEQKVIESKLRRYVIKQYNEDEILLYLREFDY
ncbi:helix-turn-helix transcriptional regulator [Priestia koreensis]|uniref:helix-turn-helix transcriptional regulator n=1 Tax=Priestia koreensis TaxID=284581 RepID=UPI00203E8B04|nr:helix-turn-helix transcriptional regulator [Priestia koreensis]MCM3006352.1 helix-turn-helix transcriptional regulator [Priestia koreensis]